MVRAMLHLLRQIGEGFKVYGRVYGWMFGPITRPGHRPGDGTRPQ